MLAREDGCGEHALYAATTHDAPVVQHPSRQRPPRRQQILVPILISHIRRLQRPARYLPDKTAPHAFVK